jgi:membrane protease YdiL (CAAX protease family)
VADALTRRPLLGVLLIEIAYLAFVTVVSLVLSAARPDLPGYSLTGPSQSLVLVIASAIVLLVFVGVLSWWTLAGFTSPSCWRDLRLYWLPIVLLAVPFLGGWHALGSDAFVLLVIAYVATAVFEEGMFRGVMVGLLRPTGLCRAVLISSLLFGIAHLANAGLRGLSPLIAAQAFGAGVQGVGFAALRLRTNTIWPLIAIHALHDLLLQMGNLPIPVLEVPIDTILLVYGIFLLRHGHHADVDRELASRGVRGRIRFQRTVLEPVGTRRLCSGDLQAVRLSRSGRVRSGS